VLLITSAACCRWATTTWPAYDPIVAIRDMLPTWMAVPYLITAFGGLLLSNNLSVYSAGLTTLTLGSRSSACMRWWSISWRFRRLDLLHADRRQFLRPVHHLHFPAGGADHRVGRDLRGRPDHRHYYSPKDLLDVSPSSAYWYRGGVEWRAFGAWAVAIVLGFSFTTIGTTAENVWFKGRCPTRGWAITAWAGSSFRGRRWDLSVLGGAKIVRRVSRECQCLNCCTPAKSSSTWSWPWTPCQQAATCWRNRHRSKPAAASM
jgi:hypothetical protein